MIPHIKLVPVNLVLENIVPIFLFIMVQVLLIQNELLSASMRRRIWERIFVLKSFM